MKGFFVAILFFAFIFLSVDHFLLSPTHIKKSELSGIFWQHTVMPGKLSQAHAFLDRDCMACHTPLRGIERPNCVTCHANNVDLLKNQPTTFHSDIRKCTGCHTEHFGRSSQITNMNHNFLAETGMRMLSASEGLDDEKSIVHSYVMELSERKKDPSSIYIHHQVSSKESLLNCNSCHASADRHFKLFGTSCVQCHSTTQWNIAEFRHPSAKSRDCVQCHQAPPSHYKMHFNMMSQKIPNRPDAKVKSCFKCHQTTHWTDIKGVGTFKHH